MVKLVDQHDIRILRNDFSGDSGLFGFEIGIGDMDVPGHNAERRVHTGAVGVEGVEAEVVVAK